VRRVVCIQGFYDITRDKTISRLLKTRVSNLLMTKDHSCYCGLVRGLYAGKITVGGIPNYQNYSVISLVYTQYANVVPGSIIKPGGLKVGAACVKIICCDVPASELFISCNFLYVCSFRNCGGFVSPLN
jgi:hypothetical protein